MNKPICISNFQLLIHIFTINITQRRDGTAVFILEFILIHPFSLHFTNKNLFFREGKEHKINDSLYHKGESFICFFLFPLNQAKIMRTTKLTILILTPIINPGGV